MVTAWGTTSSALTQVILYYFNPRSRVGNDHRPLPGFLFCRNFNPRSRVGNDNCRWIPMSEQYKFQSTFPRGERRLLVRLPDDLNNFNPRSRVGNDNEDCRCESTDGFQSTFPRGERRFRVVSNDEDLISIHVPAWGTTSRITVFVVINAISIHVPAWGTTPFHVSTTFPTTFQSTFPRGERLTCLNRLKLVSRFQSTFPRGERRILSM